MFFKYGSELQKTLEENKENYSSFNEKNRKMEDIKLAIQQVLKEQQLFQTMIKEDVKMM